MNSPEIITEIEALLARAKAPEKPPLDLRNLPGFRPLLPHEQNHRDDFTEADLPEGYRPILIGEEYLAGDEYLHSGTWNAETYQGVNRVTRDYLYFKTRTRRPLPSAPKIVPWDCPGDVPGPVCWIRNREQTTCWMVLALCKEGIHYTGSLPSMLLKWGSMADRGNYEHSTDRLNWKPCTKEAKT